MHCIEPRRANDLQSVVKVHTTLGELCHTLNIDEGSMPLIAVVYLLLDAQFL